MATDLVTPVHYAIANAARVEGAHGPLTPCNYADVARTFSEELPHQIERLNWLAEHGKLTWPGVAVRAKRLRQAAAMLQAIADFDPTGPVPPAGGAV